MELYLAAPYMNNETLYEYYTSDPLAGNVHIQRLVGSSFPPAGSRSWLLQFGEVASGLAYLHSNEVVHADVKGSNVLVTSNIKAVIIDFDLAKIPGMVTSDGAKGAGTPQYTPPETPFGTPRDKPRDVWAFSMTVAEVSISGSSTPLPL